MRILYLNHNVVGAGTYQRAVHLATQAAARGHTVTLVTTSRSGLLRGMHRQHSGVTVVEAPDLLSGGARQGWDPWNTMWRVNRLAGQHYDLVHGFDCRPNVIGPALAASRAAGAPLFLDWADWWGRGGSLVARSGWAVRTLFGPVETWFEEAFRRHAVANTVISDELRRRCIGLGVPAERVLVAPNGCEPPRERTEDQRRVARQHLGIAAETPVILHLGVMHPDSAALLFEAFRVVRETVPAVLALVGSYRGFVPRDLEATRQIIRTGFVDASEMRAWLAAADIGAIPLCDTIGSRGRWPGKISEYFTAGLPVVMPHVGAAAQLLVEHGAGCTCAADPHAFGSTMARVLADRAALPIMSERGRALAAGELAWDRIADRFFEFYERWSNGPQHDRHSTLTRTAEAG